jgi:tetratricopeptide (TPR) repeat protein
MWHQLSMGAQQAMSQQRLGEAESLLRRAIDEAEKDLGQFDNQIATLCNNLANCLRNQGKHTDAEPFYKKALEVRQKALGPLHKDEIIILENYARMLKAAGREDEGKKMEERALGIMRM